MALTPQQAQMLDSFVDQFPEQNRQKVVERIKTMDEETRATFLADLASEQSIQQQPSGEQQTELQSAGALTEENYQKYYGKQAPEGEQFLQKPQEVIADREGRQVRETTPGLEAPATLEEAGQAVAERPDLAIKETVLKSGGLKIFDALGSRAKALGRALEQEFKSNPDKSFMEAYADNLKFITGKKKFTENLMREYSETGSMIGDTVNIIADPVTLAAGGLVAKGANALSKTGKIANITEKSLAARGVVAGAKIGAQATTELAVNQGQRELITAIDEGLQEGNVWERVKDAPKEVWDTIESPSKMMLVGSPAVLGAMGATGGLTKGALGVANKYLGGKIDDIVGKVQKLSQMGVKDKATAQQALGEIYNETASTVNDTVEGLRKGLLEMAGETSEEVLKQADGIDNLYKQKLVQLGKAIRNESLENVKVAVADIEGLSNELYSSVSKAYSQRMPDLAKLSKGKSIPASTFKNTLGEYLSSMPGVAVADDGRMIIDKAASAELKSSAKYIKDLIDKNPDMSMTETLALMKTFSKHFGKTADSPFDAAGQKLWANLRENLKLADVWGEDASRLASGLSDEYKTISSETRRLRSSLRQAKVYGQRVNKALEEGADSSAMVIFDDLGAIGKRADKLRAHIASSDVFSGALTKEQNKMIQNNMQNLVQAKEWSQLSKYSKLRNSLQKNLMNLPDDELAARMAENNALLDMRRTITDLNAPAKVKNAIRNPLDKRAVQEATEWVEQYGDEQTKSYFKRLHAKSAKYHRLGQLTDAINVSAMDDKQLTAGFKKISDSFGIDDPDTTLAFANGYNYSDDFRKLAENEKLIKTVMKEYEPLLAQVTGTGTKGFSAVALATSIVSGQPLWYATYVTWNIARNPAAMISLIERAGIKMSDQKVMKIAKELQKISAASSLDRQEQ